MQHVNVSISVIKHKQSGLVILQRVVLLAGVLHIFQASIDWCLTIAHK